VDLTFACEFNLAQMYHVNKNYKEALDQYTSERPEGGVGLMARIWLCEGSETVLCLLDNIA
jgi:hypothetical protein